MERTRKATNSRHSIDKMIRREHCTKYKILSFLELENKIS
jgi:hypothetical protein